MHLPLSLTVQYCSYRHNKLGELRLETHSLTTCPPRLPPLLTTQDTLPPHSTTLLLGRLLHMRCSACNPLHGE